MPDSRKNLLRIAFLLVLAWNAIACVCFTVGNWNEPWPHPILAIDGPSYLRGAEELQTVPVWRMSDIYHSPGYQAFLALLGRLAGSREGLFHLIKLFQLACFAGAGILLYRVAQRLAGKAEAAVAVAIFSCSLGWEYYASMVQYEVLAGFLAMLALALLGGEGRFRSAVGAGLALALLAWIQSRFAVFLLVPLALGIFRAHRRRFFFTAFGCALVPLLAWIAVRSVYAGAFVPLMDGGDFRFRVGNNPNATGVAFPYVPVVEPSGWAFVFTRPGNFLWLVAQRFLFLFGLRRDLWALPPDGMPGWEIFGNGWICLITFLGGLSLTLRESYRSRFAPAYLFLAAAILPPLGIFASARFLIPFAPMLAPFQAMFLVWAFESAKKIARGRARAISSSEY